MTADDRARVCAYAAERIGFDYDLKNIIDLMRYLFPLPVPQRWRRRMMALGSGHPTRIICSALIAQAFENVRYPILPKVTRLESEAAREEILEIRHSSLFAPRDFDISPYFEVVKPTIRARLRLQGHGLGRPDHRRRRRSGALRRADKDDAVAGLIFRRACRAAPRGLNSRLHDRRRRQSVLRDLFTPRLARRADEIRSGSRCC